MISDYHLHTDFSGDSEAPARTQIERAIALGMTSICITDHHDYDVNSHVNFVLDLDRYFPAMQQLKEEYSGVIDVRIGIELGLQKHLSDYFDALLSRYSFDFIIGSTHFVHGMDPYFPEFFHGREEQPAYEDYFETLLQNIQTIHHYDVVGHIDYIVRYGPNRNRFYSYERYQDLLDSLLKTAIEDGKGIECNSAGFRKGLGEPNPCRGILKRYRELGGEILTVGSDAHAPEDLGADFQRVRDLLSDCGFHYYTTFKDRSPEFHKL